MWRHLGVVESCEAHSHHQMERSGRPQQGGKYMIVVWMMYIQVGTSTWIWYVATGSEVADTKGSTATPWGRLPLFFGCPHRILRGCECADDESGGQDGGEPILVLGERVCDEVVVTGNVENVQVQVVFK